MSARNWNRWFGDHVAQRAGVVVIAAAQLDAEGLGHGDLHVVDIAAVPDRLEDAVGEAEHQDILDGFFAEVMVDAVDLLLVACAESSRLSSRARGQVAAERFLDDQPAPLTVFLRSRPARAKLRGNLKEEVGEVAM